ncbi:hypothetical protein yc1106_09853 [Curvularia clavata]|uniref:F-box domain-containing protein n=1 Tax=Curvularia clavata TaxID=95742 RepID=A0A9Q8ZJD6_CURCL|nr:hypothetical protein yc1106_09853 [Curvularia clavata]
MATIAPPENLQPQSPLLQLPAEIKHLIFGLCLVTDTPIFDPKIDSKEQRDGPVCDRTSRISLLQTCHRIYHEVDRRPLFAHNTFRFSNLETMQKFLRALPASYSMCIQDIEIDLQHLSSDHAHLTDAWRQYLAWTEDDRKPSLRTDAVGVKCLRFNLEAWPVIPMYRCELWDVLRSILRGVAGLERVVVTGAGRGKTMAQKAPWSPVHFVGGDNVGSDDLIRRMSSCVVTRSSGDGMIKWLRKGGKVQLEVLSTPRTEESTGAQPSEDGVWPLNGSCAISAYEQHYFGSKQSASLEISPSVAE